MQLTMLYNMASCHTHTHTHTHIPVHSTGMCVCVSNCQSIHCQELQNPSTNTAVIEHLVFVIKLIINQSYEQFSAFL